MVQLKMKSYTRLAIVVFEKAEKLRHRVHHQESKLLKMMPHIEDGEMDTYVDETRKVLENTEQDCKTCSKS